MLHKIVVAATLGAFTLFTLNCTSHGMMQSSSFEEVQSKPEKYEGHKIRYLVMTNGQVVRFAKNTGHFLENGSVVGGVIGDTSFVSISIDSVQSLYYEKPPSAGSYLVPVLIIGAVVLVIAAAKAISDTPEQVGKGILEGDS